MSDDNKPIRKGGVEHPFHTYDRAFNQKLSTPYETFSASAVAGAKEQAERNAEAELVPHPVKLPKHLFYPEQAQTLDLRRRVTAIPNGTSPSIITFRAPPGATTFFQHYILQTTAISGFSFVPTVNDQRVLPFHGSPDPATGLVNVIDTASATDPFIQDPIPCLLQLQPNDVLRFIFNNASGGAVDAFIRIWGYVDKSTIRGQHRWGG